MSEQVYLFLRKVSPDHPGGRLCFLFSLDNYMLRNWAPWYFVRSNWALLLLGNLFVLKQEHSFSDTISYQSKQPFASVWPQSPVPKNIRGKKINKIRIKTRWMGNPTEGPWDVRWTVSCNCQNHECHCVPWIDQSHSLFMYFPCVRDLFSFLAILCQNVWPLGASSRQVRMIWPLSWAYLGGSLKYPSPIPTKHQERLNFYVTQGETWKTNWTYILEARYCSIKSFRRWPYKVHQPRKCSEFWESRDSTSWLRCPKRFCSLVGANCSSRYVFSIRMQFSKNNTIITMYLNKYTTHIWGFH